MASRIIRFRTGTKFRNRPTVVEGLRFPSIKQAMRYRDLMLLQRAGRVRNVRCEVNYKLTIAGAKICTYRADFVYEEYDKGEWPEVVEDTKGILTPVYRLKKKLMKALLGIEIRER